MPIRRIGFGFKGEPHRNFLNIVMYSVYFDLFDNTRLAANILAQSFSIIATARLRSLTFAVVAAIV
jgi:hypothetical protein